MCIQKCKNCGKKFKYNSLLIPFLGIANFVQCSYCGATHYITWFSRFVIPAFIILPVLFKDGILSFTPNILLSLLMYLIYVAIIKVLSPYILRYKLKDNKMYIIKE